MKGGRHQAEGDADRRQALALVPVSRETEARFAAYVDLLARWQSIKNLVGPATLPHVWTRHVADSAQLVGLAPQARRWVDLGSGAGFPGLVVAIMLHDQLGAHVDLIESNARKCAFLREVVRATGAPAAVHNGRIEDILPTLQAPADVVTARALAALPDLLALSAPLRRSGAIALFLKGGDAVDSDQAALAIESLPSLTHPSGRILRIQPPLKAEPA